VVDVVVGCVVGEVAKCGDAGNTSFRFESLEKSPLDISKCFFLMAPAGGRGGGWELRRGREGGGGR
jgi:hypothetical protein